MSEGDATAPEAGPTANPPNAVSRRRKIAKRLAIDFGLGIGLVVVALVILTSQLVWVMHSGSMQHSRDVASTGVLDSGDGMIVARPPSESSIATYIQGRATGYSSFGEHGDVVAYRKFGKLGEPVIHRAVVRVQWNAATNTWDVPDLGLLVEGRDWSRSDGQGAAGFSGSANHQLKIHRYGYAARDVLVEFGWLNPGTSGFITLGDNAATNPRIDQASGAGISDREPVRWEWIVGVVGAEIPCLAVMRLQQPYLNRAPSSQVPCAAGILTAFLFMPLLAHSAIAFSIAQWRKGHPKATKPSEATPGLGAVSETHK